MEQHNNNALSIYLILCNKQQIISSHLLKLTTCILLPQSCHCKLLSSQSSLMHGCPLHPQANYSIDDTDRSTVPGLIMGSELS